MKKALFLLFLAVMTSIGCSSQGRYLEGSHLGLGIYIPTEGEMIGFNVADWLSGISMKCPTNQTMTIEREFSVTNSYFGVVHTHENTKTKITTHETNGR